MTIRVKEGANPRLISLEVLREIVDNIVIVTPNHGVTAVTRSVTPPIDTTLPWQPIDAFGNPLGPPRYAKAGGGWQ